MLPRISSCLLLIINAPGILVSAEWIDTTERMLVRDYYNYAFAAGEAADMAWTGDYAAGDPGTVSAEWQEAALGRLRFFRALAGVPDGISFNPAYSGYAQEAAFMMSVNNAISHFPPNSWAYYTENAALAAQRSNLAGGVNGMDAILGYMADYGADNRAVGHRRWMLYPQIVEVGNADVPGDPLAGAAAINVLWIIPGEADPRPETRDAFVAWPPTGYVPSDLVFARWSFSHPGADFTNAAVSMTRNGQPVPVFQEPWTPANYGEPALIWVPDGMQTDGPASWPIPNTDESILVSVSNVILNGNIASPKTFGYEVIIFNPQQAGPEETPISVAPVTSVTPGAETHLLIDTGRESYAEAYTVRAFGVQLASGEGEMDEYRLTGRNAESLMAGAILPDNHPNTVQNDRVATETHAYHLSHPNQSDQFITLKEEFLLGEGAQLRFQSSLAWSTENQSAVVEINLGDNAVWQSVWQQGGPVENNTGFEAVTIDLSHLANRTCRIRFGYIFTGSGIAYEGSDSFFGWAFDDISISEVGLVSDPVVYPAESSPAISARFHQTEIFHIQAREIAFEGIPLDWGLATRVDPAFGNEILTTRGEWVEDPIIGWNFSVDAGWTNVVNWQWVYYPEFPWLYTGDGWMVYLSGSIGDGLWLYHPLNGYGYTRLEYGGWYLHEPFDSTSWKPIFP